jgi:hypothetical protein
MTPLSDRFTKPALFHAILPQADIAVLWAIPQYGQPATLQRPELSMADVMASNIRENIREALNHETIAETIAAPPALFTGARG